MTKDSHSGMQNAPSDWADDSWAMGDETMAPEVEDVDEGSVEDGVTAALV